MNLETIDNTTAHDCAQYLLNNIEKLAPKDRDFAVSLANNAARRGLSDKQAYWIKELTRRTFGPQKRETVSLGNFKTISDLFDKASESLRFPKIVLSNDNRTIRLSRAGSTAKIPGSINVTERDSNGESVWYGRILASGVFESSPRQKTPSDLVSTLKAFACDPIGTAKLHGQKTGNCCFCSRELTQKDSIEAGYGPICAEKYGLAWG